MISITDCVNVAIGKPVWQSSLSRYCVASNAERALHGSERLYYAVHSDSRDEAGNALQATCLPYPRPWGRYDALDSGERYQVKRITVRPEAKLSLQMHHHRAEHWVVVSGTARITQGERSYLLNENQSTYIPVGEFHSLENPGKIPLELIEVQSGAYLGEDDIVRFADNYGRLASSME